MSRDRAPETLPPVADQQHDDGGGRAAPPPVERHGDMLRRIAGARYTDDIKLSGMLHGKIVRCPHPHARIRSIDATAALAMPGVHAVVTGKDMPRKFGIIPWTPDEYPLALEVARFVGDGVATSDFDATATRKRLRTSGPIGLGVLLCFYDSFTDCLVIWDDFK